MEIATYGFYVFVMLTIMVSYQYKWKHANWYAITCIGLLLGLRGCGTDTLAYRSSFYLYVNMDAGLFDPKYYSPYYNPLYESDPRTEWFYLILIKAIKIFSQTSVWYFLIIDFLSIYLLDRFIRRFSEKERMFIAYFFFTSLVFVQMFNTMRQCLAFMAFLNITEYITNRNWRKYYICNVLLFTLHKSTLMLAPFYLFIHKDILKSRFLQFIVYFSVAIFSAVFIEQLKTVMDALYLVIDGSDAIKTSYLNSEEQALEMKESIWTRIFYFGTMIYVIYHSKKFKNAYGHLGVVIYNFMFIGMLINNVAFNRGVERINDYFDSFLFIVLGLMVYQSFFGYLKNNFLMRCYTFGILLLYFVWFANCVLQGAAECAPYLLNPDL